MQKLFTRGEEVNGKGHDQKIYGNQRKLLDGIDHDYAWESWQNSLSWG
jgi:hypothetical protein